MGESPKKGIARINESVYYCTGFSQDIRYYEAGFLSGFFYSKL